MKKIDDNLYGLLKAELYRESGEFEKCIELLTLRWIRTLCLPMLPHESKT